MTCEREATSAAFAVSMRVRSLSSLSGLTKPARDQLFGAVHYLIREGQLALTLSDDGCGGVDRAAGLSRLRLRLAQLRIQRLRVHVCDYLSCFHEVAFLGRAPP